MSGNNKVEETSQYLDNMSFDKKYTQNAVEILVEDESETKLIRQKSIATEETLQKIAGLDYDTVRVDESSADTIVTYSLAGVLVKTTTITESGDITTIVKS